MNDIFEPDTGKARLAQARLSSLNCRPGCREPDALPIVQFSRFDVPEIRARTGIGVEAQQSRRERDSCKLSSGESPPWLQRC